LRPRDDGRLHPGVLEVVEIGRRRNGVRQARLFEVTDDPHDGDRLVATHEQALPDRALPGKELPRERLVHYQHERRARPIERREFAAVDKVRADGREVAVAHVNRARGRGILPRWHRLRRNREAEALAVASKRRVLHRRRRDHARQRANAIDDLRVVACQRRVTGLVDSELRRDEVVGLKSRIDVPQSDETLRHEASADGQHHGHRDLDDDKRGSEAWTLRAGDAPAGVAKGPRRFEVRRSQGRHEAGHHASDHRRDERKGDDKAVDMHASAARQLAGRQPEKCGHAADGKRHAHQPASDREHQSLGQHLSDQPGAPRAERRRNRQITRLTRRTRQLQAGDVDAGHGQHEPDSAEQHEEAVARRPDDRLRKGRNRGAAPRLVVGVPYGEPRGNRGHLGGDLILRHAGAGAGDDVEQPHRPDPRNIGVRDRRERHVDVGALCRELHARGQHANHDVRFVVQRERGPHDRSIPSELAAPEPVREQQDAIRPTASEFLVARQAAGFGRDPKGRQQAGRDEHRRQTPWGTAPQEIDSGLVVDVEIAAEIFNLLSCRSPVVEVHRRHRGVANVGRAAGRVDGVQPARIGKRQRPEDHAVDHGENSGVRADANREGQQDGQGERRRTPKPRRGGDPVRSRPSSTSVVPPWPFADRSR